MRDVRKSRVREGEESDVKTGEGVGFVWAVGGWNSVITW